VSCDTKYNRPVLKRAVPLFLRKELAAVSYDKSHVAGAGLIDSREVNLVENSVTNREPDFAVLV
jgi:hypothetical protein